MAKRLRTDPTPETYQALQTAYGHFNRDLFADRLPPCLITLQRQRGARGYFSPDRFTAKVGSTALTTDEIAMNPQHIGNRSDMEVLSTLAHEMVHVWQHHFGTSGRGRYQNAEWAGKMEEIGLWPTSDGTRQGKKTGEHVTHLINGGGKFHRSCTALLATGLTLRWHDPYSPDAATFRKSNTRAKYTCPACDLNAWAKPAVSLVCGDCEQVMEEQLSSPTKSLV